MKIHVIAVLAVLACVHDVTASGAGRAFPIQSENYAMHMFARINRNIEWDYTNFLVDLSGTYANCRHATTHGFLRVDRTTPDGDSIQAILDDTYGREVDVDSVNEYIRKVLDSWLKMPQYVQQIRSADTFGCSTRPGCGSRMVIACLFSPSYQGDQPDSLTVPAKAFTREQYGLAESITGHRWDRSNFLENLSGQETSCSMMITSAGDWPFATAQRIASQRGMAISGLYGVSRNWGQTQPAMEQILTEFKTISKAAHVGCSLIPDCMYGGGDTKYMYVVVSCLYEEESF